MNQISTISSYFLGLYGKNAELCHHYSNHAMQMKKLFSLLVTTMVTTAIMAQWQPQGKRIKTQWADKVSPANVLPEYPRPIMERAD